MIRKILTVMCLNALLLVQGCSLGQGLSPKSVDIEPYPPLLSYTNLDCEEVTDEVARVSEQLKEATRKQDARSSRDLAVTWMSFLAYPTGFLFLLTENEPYGVAELKGRRDVLQLTQDVKCFLAVEEG